MSNDLNRVILIGRLTRDPEMRYTPAGTAVASFALANGKTFTQSGEKKEQVSYFDCIAWSKLGEIIAEYCKKGSKIAVEGRAQQSRWDDQDGKKRSKIEFVVENFQFLDSKNSDGGNSESRDNSASGLGKEVNLKPEDNPFSDDDIPF